MEILQMEQVKVSKQLLFMRERGLVEAERYAQWMIYRISGEPNQLLMENLKCLQDCAGEDFCFRADLRARRDLMRRLKRDGSGCLPAIVKLCEQD
jgi:ArsR family transcriptional regulator